ncbi:MAG: VanZ family protein [Deltaproteobacteria bacterium]|nr:VanZ family protein [Deltaproteobacteria bacterium]
MNHKYLSLAIFSALLIICMSSIPDKTLWGSGSLNEQIISNLAHIPAYSLLTFLWLKSFAGTESKNNIIVFSLILSGLAFFAVADEIHQSFVPGRTASFMDIGLDLIGIFLGLWAFKLFRVFTRAMKFRHR